MHVERLIGRYRPGCRGPDHHITFLRRQRCESECFGHTFRFGEGEADINRGIALVLIFHFGFSECGSAIEAPVHGLESAVDESLLKNAAECTDFIGLIAVVHGEVRIVPITQYTQANKIFFLSLYLLGCVGTRFGQYIGGGQIFSKLLFDLNFDRHTVAIPAGYVLRVKAFQLTCLDDHVLEDFVHRMTDVNIAVGIGRAVMQDKLGSARRGFADALIQFFLLPLRDPLRLALGKITPHREGRLGHVDRIFAFRFFAVV